MTKTKNEPSSSRFRWRLEKILVNQEPFPLNEITFNILMNPLTDGKAWLTAKGKCEIDDKEAAPSPTRDSCSPRKKYNTSNQPEKNGNL